MPKIIRSAPSETDIYEISAHIAKDNLQAAYQMLDKFDHVLNLLATYPKLGSARPKLAFGLRSFSVGNYSIYYRPISDGITLLRVLHNSQDIRRNFIASN
jgi:toxin ParE1/3/4